MIWASLVLTGVADIASAHEGHQPIPTRGVRVDTERGLVTLSAQARAAIGLETEEVRAGEVASSVVAYAETVAPWQSKAFGSARLSGRITRLLVRPGDVVSQGQVVAELSSRDLELIRLSYLQAKNDLALNRTLLESTQPAAKQGAVPLQRLDEVENAYQQSANDLELAKIRAAALGLDANQFDAASHTEVLYPIRSPIAGKIVHSELSEGQSVEAFEHLFDVVDLNEAWVKIQVLEKDLPKVAVGQSVELTLQDGCEPIVTRIDRVEVALDPPGLVGWAWATVAQPTIMPGLVGSAKIRTSTQPKCLSVPAGSVYSDGLQSYVFVEAAATKKSSEYCKRAVKLGQRAITANTGRHYVEVAQGELYPGDRVVIKGGHELSSLFFLEVLKLSSEDRARLGIRTANAEVRSVSAALSLPAKATLLPEARWTASSQLAGTIHSHQLSPGQQVRAGDLLLEIASPEYHSLQLDLLRTALDASLMRQRADRLQQANSDAFSRRVLLEVLNKADQLALKAESLKRHLVSLGLTELEVENIVTRRQIQSFLPIRAAIDGYLVRWNRTLGETVVANQSLAEIQKVQDIWIEAQVPSQDTAALSIQDVAMVSVLSTPAIRFPATVSRVGPVVSPTTRAQQVWLVPSALPQQFILRDGMQLSVALSVNERVTALAIPLEAVLRDGVHCFVFVQKTDGYLDRRRVVIGRSDGQWIEIKEGLNPGDEVIVAGGRELQTAYASLR